MGRPFRFRRRGWPGARRNPQPEPPLRFWPEDRVARRGLWRSLGMLRPFILLAVLLALWAGLDPALVEPPGFLSTEPERVSARFTRCGQGRGHACVVDGDTFKIGQRKVRIIGIDAPETHGASCPQEARLGEAATAKLQELLNQGAFDMVGRADDMQDKYGRDLRSIERKLPNGSTQSIADEMRAAGLAHRYVGFKTGWC